MDQDERDRVRVVRAEVETQMLQRPGVTGIDTGYKVVDGRKTDQLCIRIYVKKKQDVTESELIPREIKGIPTDVIERRFVLHSAADEE